MNEPIPFPVPSAAPTYLGGLGQDLNWYGQVSRYGGRWASAKPDPVIWKYTLRISFNLQVPGCAMNPMEMSVDLPVVMSGMGLNVLPAIHSGPGGMMAPQQQQMMMMQQPQQQMSGAAMVQQQQMPLQQQMQYAMQPQPQFQQQQQAYPQTQVPQQPMAYQQQQYPQSAVVSTAGYPGASSQAYPQQAVVPSLQPQPQLQSAYPTTSQQMVRNLNPSSVGPEPSAYMQSIVFPSQQSSDTQAIPDWKAYPEIRDSLTKLSHCPLVPNAGQPVLIRDAQEDYDNTDHSTLTYQPMYYSTPPTLIRE